MQHLTLWTTVSSFIRRVGISGSALQWFSSYLSDRSFSVAAGNFASSSENLFCGVSRGSALGPILFALYMLPLWHILRQFNGISYHCYTGDIQLHISFKPQNTDNLSVLNICLDTMRNWMADNLLQLNATKTEVLISAPPSLVPTIMDSLGSLTFSVKSSIRNLVVTMDQALTLHQHVKCLIGSCFFQLRNTAKARSIVSRPEMEMFIHAFISSHLDYCNLLFTFLSKKIPGSSRSGPKCCC